MLMTKYRAFFCFKVRVKCITITVILLSNERSLALNDTDNRAEKGSLENKKIYFPGLVRFHGRGKRYQLGIGSVN